MLKEKYKKIRDIIKARAIIIRDFSRRHFPLVLAVAFLVPAGIGLYLFISWRLNKVPVQAAPFTGAVRVSKENTALSTAGGWLKAMAFSGDGANGDGDYFQPIHPGTRTTTEGAAGSLAVGEVAMPTTTLNNYDGAGAVFIPWRPNADGNFYGVTLGVVNINTTAANLNVVVEVLRFPTASYGPPWTNYASCTAVNTCTYPADTVIERAQVMRFDQSISGETAYPGNYGIHYMDFRFDPLTVTTASHYGFRVYYNSLTTSAGWPRNGTTKPLANAINFGLGIANVDVNDANTATIPLANTSNMVALNSAPAVGQAAAIRTQNEHWRGTYSSATSNWTIIGSVSGTQTNKLTTAATGASWVNDGVTTTTLTADSTATTRLCVNSISGFAANQYIDLWDSDTASAQYTISAVNSSDASCPASGPSIITTAASVTGYTTNKNAAVARAIWKQRIIQGAEEAFSQDMPSTTKICVADASQFSVRVGAANSVSVWDNNSALINRAVTAVTTSGDASCASGQSVTVDSAITAGTYTVAQNARVAEISANFSNSGTPDDGDVFRFTSMNMGQNPAKIGSGNSFLLLYGKTAAPATSAVNYPYLTNQRHAFFIAYGDADTSAPVDGDMVIVGGGAADPDVNDSPNLSNDLIMGSLSPHAVSVDKNFDMPLAYTGATGGGVGNGLTTPATASYGGSGFISMLITTRAKLGVSDAAGQRYRLTAPGRILLSSGAALELGSATDPLPQTTSVDLYEDSVGPQVSSNLTVDSGAVTYIDVASTAGFYIGDVVMIKDNNSVPTTRIVAAVTSSTRLTFTAAMVAGYTVAQNAIVSRGSNTDIPTGADRRSFVYSARAQAARVNMYSQGSDDYRTPRADLAVDIDGNIDTGYLGAQQTTAGNTWADVSGELAGEWSALDPISVAQGNNYAVNNYDSSIGMGADDDASVFPTWTGVGTLGLNADASYNAEQTEIGTIPLTNIYNADYNGGSPLYSSNYQTTSAWTIFNDGANTEENDAVYFGDQGNTPIYALEFNIGTAINASATRVWEYWNGSAWTEFTPKFGWKYAVRGNNVVGGLADYCMPFNASPTYPTATVQLTDTNALFAPGQYVKIKDDDSPTVIRRISTVTAGAPANIVFTEVVPSGYTTGANAKVCVPNGGQWQPMTPTDLFTQTGRTMISWNSWDTANAAKTTVNGANGYWVRNRISSFTSWTTSPANQTTPAGMQGVETISSYPFTVFNSVNEAKFNHLSKGASFDPNETWTLRYNDNSTAVSILKTTRWYESQIASWGTAHRWQSPNPDGETSAYYEKNSSEGNWHTLNGNFSWTDYSVYAKVYANAPSDGTRKMGIFLRQDADDYGYGFYIVPNAVPASSTLRWYTIAAGAETAIGTATATTINAYQWYCVRAEVNGTTLQAKVWSPVSEDADCNGDANEPGGWTESEVGQTTYTAGRFGLACDAAYCRFDDVTVRNTGLTETWFNDNFNNTGCWRVIGSIHGDQGCAYNSIPFTSSYINFTIKHKGGAQCGETGVQSCINQVNNPEQGDEIYISPLMRGSNIGLDETEGITTDDDETKYENWDFVYDSTNSHWDVAGSQYGAAGTAAPGSTYTSPDGEISLKIKSGTPSGPKFGTRAAYFQNSYQRATGNFTGLNNHNSAIIIQPTWAVAGSATGYNIEGSGGVAAQKGTIDFWFKPNFTGSPDYIQYLFDYAANSNTDRILVRLMPSGVIEAVVGPAFGSGANTKMSKSFSAVAGQWYHFRLAWEDNDAGQLNMERAWLDGEAFTANQGATIGARAANAGYIRLGNSWQYNAGFDGVIDEFAVFNDAADTSPGDNWGNFTPPSSAYTAGQTLGTATNIGTNIFLAHFDGALEPRKGTMFADYFAGHPVMAFTNGADTITNDRIRVTTYPQRTRLWVDNTGSQYTPSARVKYSEGYNPGTAPGAETGWGQSFQYHHRAVSDNEDQPITSPVLNLRKQIRIWSDEDVTTVNATAPVNQGYGVLLYWPKTTDINHLEMDQMYYGLYLTNNPFTAITPYPTQYIRKSAFNNVQYSNIYTLSKTLGSQVIDNNNFSAAGSNYYAFQESASANITFSNNYVTGGHSSGYFTYWSGGRVFTLSGNKFFSGLYPVWLTAGTAKVTLSNNEFWRFRRGLTLNGNSFVVMSGNSFDGGTSSEATNGYYGTGIHVVDGTTNVEISDSDSVFGRSIWNEADVNMPPNATSYLAGSLLRYIGENSSFNSNFHYLGLTTQDKFGGEYLATAIPGVDVRLGTGKDIVNYSNFGLMRTTGEDLIDETVRTSGGYGWRLESTSKTDALEYTSKVVGVSGKPLAVTGYLRINDDYGTANLPTVTLSGLGMTGPNLTWTAATTTDTWQQFVVSGTPTESALATVTFAVQSEPTLADSGTAENVDDGQGINLPTIIEDADKSWAWNQWAGYKMRDDKGFIFGILGNTATRLFLKGTRIPFGDTLPTQPYGAAYEIYSPPYAYLDDVSVLSGTVDTGTLDFHSQGQPVSPWLSTGLTAEGVWSAQYSLYSDIQGSFGQLVGDALVAGYAEVSDLSPTTTEFDTDLTSATDDFYNNGVIIFTEGDNEEVVRRISDYGGASKTITVDPALPFAPADGDRFAILAATASASGGGGGASAAEIWSYVTRTLTAATLDSGSLATAADVADIRADIADVLTELGTGNISAIKTKTDSINWSDVTGLITTSGDIKAKTDTIVWGDITAIKTKTDTINWSDVTGIKLNTDTIVWGDITAIKNNVATLISEIGAGNISAIKTATDTIDWDDITGIITNTGLIKDKTDTIDWANVTGIKTKTDTIDWDDVTGIKTQTDTIAWGDIAILQSSVDALNDISAADVWTYATRTLTGEVTLTSDSRKAIWDTACAILNTSGSVGKLVCDNLDTTVSSRSTLTASDVWNNVTRTITNLENPALSAIANSIWSNATRTLTSYGNDITAQDVWDVLTSSLVTVDSIGELLVTNVDEEISSRASQTSVDNVATNVSDIEADVDVPVSSRASQASLDSHEASQAAFRSSTTTALNDLSIDVAAISSQLSGIETKIDTITTTLNGVDTKIDTIDANLDSVKTTVEDTNVKVAAVQTVANNILNKWGSYSAADIIGYVDTLEDSVGTPDDLATEETLFGRIKEVKESLGGGGTIDLIWAQVQATRNKLVEVQGELGFNGKSTTAYDEIMDIKGYVDEAEGQLAELGSATDDIAGSVSDVSDDLEDVTDRIGKVSPDSFAQHFEIKKTDIDYLKNKIIELKAIAEIDRQLIERTIGEPIVKVLMEWGSVVIKFIIVNPSDSTDQKIPFKAYLPKEVKQEYIMDLGGMALNYDATTEQYYVSADLSLKAGESVTRAVEIKDIWIISEDEVDSLRKQSEDLAAGLVNTSTSYNAQAVTLKTDINTRLDKIVRKQKDSNATPQDHILAYRENHEELKAVNENIKGLKDMVLNSGTGSSFLASIGGIQAFATWGVVLALIFGMGTLGFFYYELWKRKVLVSSAGGKKSATGAAPAGGQGKTVKLPTPWPFQLPGLTFSWLKKIVLGLALLIKHLAEFLIKIIKALFGKIFGLPKKILIPTFILILLAGILTAGFIAVKKYGMDKINIFSSKEKTSISALSDSPEPAAEEISNEENAAVNEEEEKDKKVAEAVQEISDKAQKKIETNKKIDELIKKSEPVAENGALTSIAPVETAQAKKITVTDTPTGWLNVREQPSVEGALLAKIYPGESYEYKEIQNSWYKVVLKDKTEGWVSGEYIKEETAAVAVSQKEVLGADVGGRYVIIKQTASAWADVYESPSSSADIIGKVYPGESYNYGKVYNGWRKIILRDGKEGWVAGENWEEGF